MAAAPEDKKGKSPQKAGEGARSPSKGAKTGKPEAPLWFKTAPGRSAALDGYVLSPEVALVVELQVRLHPPITFIPPPSSYLALAPTSSLLRVLCLQAPITSLLRSLRPPPLPHRLASLLLGISSHVSLASPSLLQSSLAISPPDSFLPPRVRSLTTDLSSYLIPEVAHTFSLLHASQCRPFLTLRWK